MPYRVLLLGAVAAVACLGSLSASTDRMPLDEVRPGMTGVGITVFEGEQRAEFTVDILGVLRNVNGPRRNLILARLEGGPLATTGVIQGMSGSPVYIDDRLVGAVSHALGSFAKEAIAGITPIDEMLDAVSLPASRPAAPRVDLEFPITNERLVAVFRQAFSRVTPFADHPGDVEGIGLPLGSAGPMATMLRPIATPLVLGGFHTEVPDLLWSAFRDHGFSPIASGGQSDSVDDHSAGPLQPGDAVAVSLISGDLALAATGTVTLVDGDRVYAFGHRFQNLGPIDFIMNRAHVHTLLPSLLSSTKIATIGEPIGTFQQDRSTAIAGTLGVRPKLIPISVSLEAADGRRQSSTFRFQVVNDQLLTPLLAYVSVLNTLQAYERQSGAATFTVEGTATVKDHEDIAFDDVFTGDAPSLGVATYVAAPITFLLHNDFEPIELQGLDLRITSLEEPRTAILERVWLNDIRPRAGHTVRLQILTRTYRGDEVVRTVPIQIPFNARGSLSVLVSGGPQLAQWDRRELSRPLEPRSVDELIRTFNNARRNNTLYIRLLSSDAGAVVGGERLASLPPSTLAVIRSDRSSGRVTPLSRATIDEWEITTDHAVRGSHLITFSVDRE